MDKNTVHEKSLQLHKEHNGKLEVTPTIQVNNKEDLALAYTPGIAGVCKMISEDKENAYQYTIKGKTVAIISNGTAVLGLGDIGPEASMPVLEGKALLLKKFGGVNAFPIIIDSKDKDEIVNIISKIAPGFGGIHLEDIKAPECFYIEDELKKKLDIPVYHDDQHGTAIAVLAGLINSLKIVDKKLEDVEVVINGAGASGIAIAKLLLAAGVKNIVLVDLQGALVSGDKSLNDAQEEIAKVTNLNKESGTLEEVIKNKDVFIGVSDGNVMSKDTVRKMKKDSIIFALANPTPEIMPEEAKLGGAKVTATGRSDFDNQLNNVLVFPGIFKGALKARVKNINDDIKIAAAKSLANLVSKEELSPQYIIPSPFDKRVPDAVANAVIQASK
ncbi:MAG TPA: NADP-dependent malic enzyme [Tissierellaceae bacterium]